MMNTAVPDKVLRMLEILRGGNHAAYVVGGCVRDNLSGITPHDWDICTSASVEDIQHLFHQKGFHVAPTGLKHGTLTVVDGGQPYEITTFKTKAAHSEKPSLREDLSLRDFTINAMAWSKEEGLTDPFGGARDLQAKVLRCVESAHDRLTEDPLRILRALRFAACMGFVPDAGLQQAMHELAPLLKTVAVERITAELYRFMQASGENIAALLREYADVFCTVMPELKPMIGFEQHNFHHIYDVWEHTLKAMEASRSDDRVLHFVILFHDMGKPNVFSMDARGVGHFYGHGEVSRDLCSKLMNRLRFDAKTATDIRTLVELHDARVNTDTRSIKRWLNRLGLEQFERLLQMKRCDAAGQNPEFWAEREAYEKALRAGLQEVLAQDSCFCIKDLAVNGNDLIKAGYKADSGLGRCLQRLLDEVLDEKLPNEKAALLQQAVLWLKQETKQ